MAGDPLPKADIVGVGYEGRTIDDFVVDLAARGVEVLADVRLTPISRKKGFSKRQLAQALAAVGITYQHLPELGNPKDNRAGFAGDNDELNRARSLFSERIALPAATD